MEDYILSEQKRNDLATSIQAIAQKYEEQLVVSDSAEYDLVEDQMQIVEDIAKLNGPDVPEKDDILTKVEESYMETDCMDNFIADIDSAIEEAFTE